MELTTKTAKELKVWKDNFNFNNKLRIDAVINLKNELREEDTNFTDTPEGNLSFRLWIRKRLIEEIESVEK